MIILIYYECLCSYFSVRKPLKDFLCRSLCQSTTSNQESGNSENTNKPKDDDSEYVTRQRVLQSSMPFVHTHGWTNKALAAGAEVEGLPGIAHGLFPRGGVELIFYFYTDCNRRMADKLAEQVKQESEAEGKIKIGPFVRGALESRLRMIHPYIDKWPPAMGKMALPQNAPDALSHLLKLTDEIWYYAGDQSTDFNWYTKRASLAAVYKSTEVFMVQDRSAEYNETWQFLDRRLNNVEMFGKAVKNSQQSGDTLREACEGIYTVTRNIIGANARAK